MDEAWRLVHDLVSVPSPTGDTEAMTHLLLSKAEALGLRAHVDGGGNVHMTAGEGEPRVLLLCHMDTVRGDLPVRIEDGFIHGRGSVDAKGCLAAAMTAAALWAGRPGPGTVEVVAVPDEEGASLGARHLVGEVAPGAVIVGEPSGWQGITIGYKGALRLRFLHRSTKVHAGAAGINSAQEAVTLWNALEGRLREEAGGTEGRGAFDVPAATMLAINTVDDGLVHSTEMLVDVRLPPGHDTEALLAFLDAARGDAEMEVQGMESAVVVPKNTPVVRALLAAIRAEGGEPVFKRKTGTSDMNVAAAGWPGVPIVAYGPGDSRLDHTPDERLDLVELSRAVRVIDGALEHLVDAERGRSKL